MQVNTTEEVIAWNKHSVRTENPRESNILIEKQKTTTKSFPFVSQKNDYSKAEAFIIYDPERYRQKVGRKISKLQSFFLTDRWNADAALPEGRKRTSFLVQELKAMGLKHSSNFW